MKPHQITVVVGNVSERSRTKVLAQAIGDALATALPVQLTVLEIAHLTSVIGVTSNPQDLDLTGRLALQAIANADLVVAVSPVYKGSYSGLFKHLFDLVPPDALVDRPVLLAANGGSDRHALVVDHQLRPLFSFFRALTVPSAVYASEADFDGYLLKDGPLRKRIGEAAAQAAGLLSARRAVKPPLRAVA
ncbi:NAD(P)H-dependent oxidoreductase [Leptothrix discophora]|uniref:NAD(P)H-dependent oxidoreductase n=1 Tax=Leptothrix discophora TaxID=89 RepID=A0ABT9G410_LEPDI|nr:NAD(P)H-dependent oxidoreductase [Leptothrix discophora]MDP4301228.1 NAD(P)H-dependent oxidoreductase [Leptothrix discophora]